MTQLLRHSVTFLMVCLVNLFITTPVMAIPSLPSSFYGEVRVNGKNLPDGSVVRALINGQVYAEGYTQTYQNASVYVLDIPGDDAATTILEGGHEGDTVRFEVGGIPAEQTGMWHSGMNVRLDLTASGDDAVIVTQATPWPVPTQTPIILTHPLPTDLASVQSLSTTTALTQPVFTSTAIGQLLPTTTTSSQSLPEFFALGQPSPTFHSTSIPVAAVNIEENSSIRPTLTVAFMATAIVMGGSFWLVFKKLFIIRKSSRSKQHKTIGGL